MSIDRAEERREATEDGIAQAAVSTTAVTTTAVATAAVTTTRPRLRADVLVTVVTTEA